MAEYLLPFNDKMSIDEKQRMFSLKNRMVDIPDNFGKVEKCACGQKENMSHLFMYTIEQRRNDSTIWKNIQWKYERTNWNI